MIFDKYAKMIIENKPMMRMLYLTYLEKLTQEGYCDMNKLISGSYNKNSFIDTEHSGSHRITELYQNVYPKSPNEGLAILEDFFQKYMDEYEHSILSISVFESLAIINYIYKCFSKKEERISLTLTLAKQGLEHLGEHNTVKFQQGFIFLDNIEIQFLDTLHDFIKHIKSLSYDNESRLYFRGHSFANHLLIPSIMRKSEWELNENKMYNELIIRCPKSFNDCNTHLEYLVQMQHYGLPTRLLDITSNPLVALYFACTNISEKYGEVIILKVATSIVKYPTSDTVTILACLPLFEHSYQTKLFSFSMLSNDTDFNIEAQRLLHEIKTEKPAFRDIIRKDDIRKNLVVVAVKNNDRIIKQDGAFILCGLNNNDKNTYKETGRDYKINTLRYSNGEGKKVILIISNKKQIIDDLDRLSINRASLFPEIDNVAEYIKQSIHHDF